MKGIELEEHFRNLDRVRSKTIEEMRKIDDERLNAPQKIWGSQANLHWMFFHVMEDELRHTGQITWLLKRLPG
jgi:uncharacterized damage-inducible protein DinB